MLCRAGIGRMTIVDGDKINESNINRQLPALRSTIGMYKTEMMEQRLMDINPELELKTITEFI
jgi:tRNA A37 threonylcarbamoyladenosine dehydratase